MAPLERGLLIAESVGLVGAVFVWQSNRRLLREAQEERAKLRCQIRQAATEIEGLQKKQAELVVAIETMPGRPADEQFKVAEQVGVPVPRETRHASWTSSPQNGRAAAVLIVTAPSSQQAMDVLDEHCLTETTERVDSDLAYFAMMYRTSQEAGEDGDDRIIELIRTILEWNYDEDGLALAGKHFSNPSPARDVQYLTDLYAGRKR